MISFAESRSILEQISIPGEIIHTPGHSDGSVSLLLDDGSAFTGDLTHPALATLENAGIVAQSWQMLRKHDVTRICPRHGPIRSMETFEHADFN